MKGAGISNRETPQEEAQERAENPPLDISSPAPQDAAGRVGEDPLTDMNDRQTSLKAGSHSTADKQNEARYPEGPMPQTAKVDGAFGKEPDEADRDGATSDER
jgi:hypothetical protein